VDDELAVANRDRAAIEDAGAHEAGKDPAVRGQGAEQLEGLHPLGHHQVEELPGLVLIGRIQRGHARVTHGGAPPGRDDVRYDLRSMLT
jgi:hypothetical protein